MKVIEILNFNKELLKKFQTAGIRMDDVQYIDLFNEYRALLTQAEKVSYIVAVLATKYGVSERKVYDLIRRFKSELEVGRLPRCAYHLVRASVHILHIVYR